MVSFIFWCHFRRKINQWLWGQLVVGVNITKMKAVKSHPDFPSCPLCVLGEWTWNPIFLSSCPALALWLWVRISRVTGGPWTGVALTKVFFSFPSRSVKVQLWQDILVKYHCKFRERNLRKLLLWLHYEYIYTLHCNSTNSLHVCVIVVRLLINVKVTKTPQ